MYSKLSDTWFFTTTINSWKHLLSDENRKQIIVNSFDYCCLNNRMQLYAFVIMPNHIHAILHLSESESIDNFQRNLLKFTSQQIIKLMINSNEQQELDHYRSTQADRIYHIWERRPKWIKIENTLILEQKIDYVHNNPLQAKWNLAASAEDYEWSSAAFYRGDMSRFLFLTHYTE